LGRSIVWSKISLSLPSGVRIAASEGVLKEGISTPSNSMGLDTSRSPKQMDLKAKSREKVEGMLWGILSWIIGVYSHG